MVTRISPRKIIKPTIQRSMSRENNRWLGWKRITQNMQDKMATEAFRRARNYGCDDLFKITVHRWKHLTLSNVWVINGTRPIGDST